MSYKTTNRKLIGRFRVKNHAIERFKKRHGNEYIGNTKIKNMSNHKLRQKIIKSIKERTRWINEQKDGSLEVITKDFKAIVMPYFWNTVITII